MTLKEALFNWLQIKVVWDARPQDRSAEETAHFFRKILEVDHGVEAIEVQLQKQAYHVHYRQSGSEHEVRFERDHVKQLLTSIETEPKYNQNFSSDSQED
ncbi:hypothetical protein [Desmospora activa]|uniref:Uncharacterized protein n=1 Tax=Desmospora activa DSM 45169 TaxID=1121389 RepID=A0A2T4ZBJ9_9BACL|nr:hypothetical protein [Desmospora activa]PTM59274.1 hypothetical protein C8J48_1881 [Desmospora activa DSM 45169]